jgi:ATP-dependent Clp protease adaptor protein ClpS
MVKEQNSPSGSGQEALSEESELVLHNDDVNTFDFVIDTLVEVCSHDPLQAEQIALIAHHKGKCGALSGTMRKLKPPCEEMTRRGLSVSIE